MSFSFFVTGKCQQIQKIGWKSLKITNIGGESLHIFWTTWGIWMNVSGKRWVMIILTKNQDFTLSLEDAFLEKPRGEMGGGRSWDWTESPSYNRNEFVATFESGIR